MQKQRQDQILNILKSERYVTVKYLTGILHYSTATLNRDLNEMQRLGLVKRSYGGVEAVNAENLPPLPARQFYMHKEKRRDAYEAAKLIRNGETVFLDASTTVQHIVPFIADKKNLTVVTNSMLLAIELSKYDIEIICLGGKIVERPHVLDGDETVENAMRYHVDKMFFSINMVTPEGELGDAHYLLYKVMLKNSGESYLLTDKTKLVGRFDKCLCDFSSLSGVISDFEFPEETLKKFPNVKFICSADANI